jgi:hypothetical protein
MSEKVYTYGDMMSEMQACTTKDDADALVEKCIAIALKADPLLLREEARRNTLASIGYMTGYLNRVEAARILQLFETRHPVFGAMKEWPNTPEETLEMGIKAGMRAARERSA